MLSPVIVGMAGEQLRGSRGELRAMGRRRATACSTRPGIVLGRDAQPPAGVAGAQHAFAKGHLWEQVRWEAGARCHKRPTGSVCRRGLMPSGSQRASGLTLLAAGSQEAGAEPTPYLPQIAGPKRSGEIRRHAQRE